MKKLWVKILLGLVVLFILVAVLAWIFIGTIIKTGVEKVGPVVTKVPVTLDGAVVSIIGGSGSLKGLTVGNPEGFKTPHAIKVGKASLSIAPGSLLKEKKHIRSIVVEAPEITYELDLKGSNLGKILDNVSSSAAQDEKAPTKEQQTTKTKLQVDEFLITGAKVNVAATIVGSAPALSLPEIRLKNLGQGPDGITPAELTKQVLKVIVDETSKAVAANAGKIGETGKALGTSAADQLKKGAGGIGDLLRKKEK
jgi:uncharacterized protein involved in outer membrane biogenesis